MNEVRLRAVVRVSQLTGGERAFKFWVDGGDGDGDAEDLSGENDDWKSFGIRWMMIETLKNQPGHVRDIRVVMNHVRVVCPILLKEKNYNSVIFCFKSPLH